MHASTTSLLLLFLLLMTNNIVACFTPPPSVERTQNMAANRHTMRLGAQHKCDDDRIAKLERRVQCLEEVLREIAGAIIYSDDTTLLEKLTRQSHAAAASPRQPILLRTQVMRGMRVNGLSPKMVQHYWRPLSRTRTESDTVWNASDTQ